MNYPPQKIIEQLAEVRETAEVNMLDADGVQRVAHERDLYELVTFIDDNDFGTYASALDAMGKHINQ